MYLNVNILKEIKIDHILQHNVLTCEKYCNKQLKPFPSFYLQPQNDKTHLKRTNFATIKQLDLATIKRY